MSVHAERPWNYPMEPVILTKPGRPDNTNIPENIAHCEKCIFDDCIHGSVKKCIKSNGINFEKARAV